MEILGFCEGITVGANDGFFVGRIGACDGVFEVNRVGGELFIVGGSFSCPCRCTFSEGGRVGTLLAEDIEVSVGTRVGDIVGKLMKRNGGNVGGEVLMGSAITIAGIEVGSSDGATGKGTRFLWTI